MFEEIKNVKNTEFQHKNIIPSANHRGISIMIWARFAASVSGWLAIIDGAMSYMNYTVNIEGTCQDIFS